MALLTYQSVQTNSASTSATVVVTKPTGLTAGDLMLSQFTVTSPGTVVLPSGFTEIERQTTTASSSISVLSYKIATSGDAAASDFTFNAGATTDMRASIIRISNPKSSPIGVYSQATEDSANITSPAITQSKNNSLLFFFTKIGNAYTVSGYTIATSNPTWTEIYDTSDANGGFSCAYAFRSPATSTGTASANISSSSKNIGQLIEVLSNPQTSLVEETVTMVETITKKIKRTFTDTLTLSENTTSSKGRNWNKTTKPTTTWVNKQK
jgi:hypothetical protein